MDNTRCFNKHLIELGITKIGGIISDMGRFLGSANTCLEGAMEDSVNVTSERIYNEFKCNKKTHSVSCSRD